MTSSDSVSIALDAMGGDLGPEAVIKGADLVLSEEIPCERKLHLSIYGKKDAVMPVLGKYKRVEKNSVFIDVPDAVLSDDRPSFALRHRRRSSMWCAVEDVKKGVVSAAISPGNTGALMAMSKYLLGTLHGVDRPAIAKVLPSRGQSFVILDLGANVECGPDTLLQFAIMGRALARAVLGRENPKVGLLNVGGEETKGTSAVKEAFALMRNAEPGMNFHGYVEAGDAFGGVVDVVVTDGFSGNILLKTCEAVADLSCFMLQKAMRSYLLGKIAICIFGPGLKKHTVDTDARSYNGAVLLGLNGVVVKSHGSADGRAFGYAIKNAVCSISQNIISRIASEMQEI
ncbi:MAG: phosphate acyltransferase PlsX [Anaplasma sp.]